MRTDDALREVALSAWVSLVVPRLPMDLYLLQAPEEEVHIIQEAFMFIHAEGHDSQREDCPSFIQQAVSMDQYPCKLGNRNTYLHVIHR